MAGKEEQAVFSLITTVIFLSYALLTLPKKVSKPKSSTFHLDRICASMGKSRTFSVGLLLAAYTFMDIPHEQP